MKRSILLAKDNIISELHFPLKNNIISNNNNNNNNNASKSLKSLADN
ncbi:hypothetical protein [Formosa sp. PL04]|nr:hypothetical protein [Formosa sp. PL04]MDW5287556.1 hypothetical protein [Formosa sp. PL04]